MMQNTHTHTQFTENMCVCVCVWESHFTKKGGENKKKKEKKREERIYLPSACGMVKCQQCIRHGWYWEGQWSLHMQNENCAIPLPSHCKGMSNYKMYTRHALKRKTWKVKLLIYQHSSSIPKFLITNALKHNVLLPFIEQ